MGFGDRKSEKVNRLFELDAINRHPKDAVPFFQVMMRLEYSLKAIGYVAGRGTRLVVLWDDYVSSRLKNSFFEDVKRMGIAKTLIEFPPSRQILNCDKKLDFETRLPPLKNAIELFQAVRRLRNNLFHGGKSGDPDHRRNDTLISEAVTVIDKLLDCDDELRREFEGLY